MPFRLPCTRTVPSVRRVWTWKSAREKPWIFCCCWLPDPTLMLTELQRCTVGVCGILWGCAPASARDCYCPDSGAPWPRRPLRFWLDAALRFWLIPKRHPATVHPHRLSCLSPSCPLRLVHHTHTAVA